MELSADEKDVIKRFADGDKSERDRSISIYRDFIAKNGIRRDDPFINFMSEIDNPVPDLGLRARYREEVCKWEIPSSAPGR